MSATDLLALDGIAARAESVRWDVLDLGLAIDGDPIHPSEADSPQITNDGNATSKRALRGLVMTPGTWEHLNLARARIRPSWVLGDGTTYPLGVFLFANPAEQIADGGSTLKADMVDQTFILAQDLLEPVGWPQGHNITDAMAEVVALYNLPAFDITSSSATFPDAYGAPDGTSGQKVLDDLAQAAGFFPPYFDNTGTGILRPNPPPELITSPDFVWGPGTTVVNNSPVSGRNFMEAPNVWRVTGGGTNSPVVGTYTLPSSAEVSIANRGFAVVESTDNSAVSTPTQARTAARAEAQGSQSWRTLSFTTTPEPTVDTFNTMKWPDKDGPLYLVTRWSLDLEPGGSHQWEAVFLDETNAA